ncbi:structural maintenance of chromosomes protein 5 [Plasmodium brasilianum]|uniref:Structural maintenance of chromosomes protein 5 n=2 Tax=Plasmodium (Plasmodium) TaxID=418103 RepID=A0A1A8W319_PLAMA|nr:structural maintenance of chromosomes protein 5 [Plasmodium brasilianum]SBS85545.1 conserved Plasmodium protein, unknown function [Plasmodium malariae]
MAFSNKRKLVKPEKVSNKKKSNTSNKNRDNFNVKTEINHVNSDIISIDDEKGYDKCSNANDSNMNDRRRTGRNARSTQMNRNYLDDSTECFKNLKKGAVIEITVYNWMVFSGPIKLKAQEGINLIAAANASGKSSIVCALVFGLGYNSNVLSRNKELINFIKKGEKKSYIEIVLKCNELSNICIKRIMNIIDNKVKSFWFINNTKVNYINILDMQKEFNLNLDNLITFMPQENVSKFSRLTPEELFECTLLAIDKKLLDDYNYLKKIVQEKKDDETRVQMYEHEIKEEEKLVTDLQEKIAKFENLKSILATAKLYRVKKSMLAMSMKKEQLKKLKERIDTLVKEKDTHFNTLRFYLSELEKCHKVINSLSIEYTDRKKKIREAVNEYIKMKIKFEEIEKEILKEEKVMEDTVQNMCENKEYIKDLEKKKKEVKEEMQRIEAFFKEKQKYSKDTQKRQILLEVELKELSNQNKQLLMKKYTLQSEHNSLVDKLKKRQNYQNIQEEKFLNNIEFTLRERIMNYKKNIKNIVKTYNLLSDHFLENLKKKYDESKIASQNELNNEIMEELSKKNILYGPLCKYIKCIQPQFDYVVEFFLKKYFNSFLLIQKENKDLLEALYKKYKLSVITVSRENHKYCYVTYEMKKRGVEYFLYELFDSPEVVKNGLINFLPINIAFIVRGNTLKNKGTNEINEFNNFMIKEITKQLNEDVSSLLYFCDNNVHRYKISTYDKNIFIDNFSFIDKKCKILYYINNDVKKDLNNLNEKKDKCEEELQKLQQTFQEFEKTKRDKNDEYNKIILEKSEINLKKNKFNLLKKELNTLEENLNLYLKGENVIDEKRNRVTKNINILNEKKINICDTYFTILKEHRVYDKEVFTLSHKITQWKRYLTIIKNENSENEEKHQTLKNSIELEKTKYTSCLHDINELEQLIKVQKKELTKEEINALKDIHLSFEELEKKLQECLIQQKIYNNLDKSEEKYNMLVVSVERHKESIENKKKEIHFLKKKLENYDKQTQFVLPNWVNQINEYIIFLNYNFQKFMNFINSNYDGRIELIKKNDFYEKCQLFIKVKFKTNAPFLLLSISHQSGGERSLTTMLYILSIQKLTKNGFYVLDELNQGLDQTNEKRIFELLSCLSNPTMYKQHFLHDYQYKYIKINYHSKPQYFILTPQIIKNMFFKDITVHYLFNGFGVLDDQFLGFYD